MARRRAKDRDGPHRHQEALDGKHVEWLMHVSDEQYAKA